MSRKTTKKLPEKRDDDIIAEGLRDKTTDLTKKLGVNHGGLAKSWEVSSKSCKRLDNSSSLPQLRYSTRDLKAYEDAFDRIWYWKGSSDTPFYESNTQFKHIVSLENENRYNYITMGLTGVSRPLFMFYKQTCPSSYTPYCRNIRNCFRIIKYGNAHVWVKYNSMLIDPHSSTKQYMQFGNAVGLNGKFYALSLQGTLVVIEEIDTHMVITRVGPSRAVPSVPSRHFREYLVESDGEIWMIFLISTKTTSSVDDVEIFRLQMENIAWKKVERLGKDRAVFIGGKCCLIVAASEVGCKGNCVFFTNCGVDGWWAYDMAKGDISRCSSGSDSSVIFG